MLLRHDSPTLVIHAPAKLNLFLEVLGERADGYHELETLMVAVNLYDTLTFTEEPSQTILLRCYDAGSVTGVDAKEACVVSGGQDNLVVQAANLLRRHTGENRGVRIELFKRIPVAAGLAGGSSDAAATLVGLNRHWNLDLNAGELQQLASQLGSDVGFFLTPSAVAVCRGRGEKVESLQMRIGLHFVIARPYTGLSTASVFRQFQPQSSIRRVDCLVECLKDGRLASAACYLHNSLQPSAEELNTEVKHLRTVFSELPVLGHMMSGSGTAYFGLCGNRHQARVVAARLRASGLGRVYQAQSRP